MRIRLAKHLGYCLGVRRAMNMAFAALRGWHGPVLSVGPLIHNQAAFDLLAGKGMALYREGMEIPPGALLVIRAHGLPPEKEAALRASGATLADATCPKVQAVQRLVRKEAEGGRRILIWGKEGHPEVEGLLGHAMGQGLVLAGEGDLAGLPDFGRVLLVAQTTQDAGAWERVRAAAAERFAGADFLARSTICQATVDRQREALAISREVDAVVVVGGRDSGNTRRLVGKAEEAGRPAVAVEGPEGIPPGFLDGKGSVGLLAGASTPNWQIRMVAQALAASGREGERSLGGYLRRLFRALVLSNTYLSLGCGVLGWAAAGAMGFRLPGTLFCLYVYFCLANHLLHGFTSPASSRFNDPDRAAFLLKYEKPLIFLALLAVLLSFTAVWPSGWRSSLCLLAFAGASLAFALPWPAGWGLWREDPLRAASGGGHGRGGPHGRGRHGRGRGPGHWLGHFRTLVWAFANKTIRVSYGWALLLTLVPWFHEPPLMAGGRAGLLSLAAGWVAVFLQVFTRNFLMDMLDAFGDRVFERETPASVLGPRRAPRLLGALLGLWALFLAMAYLAGALNGAALCLILSGPAYNAMVLRRLVTRLGLGGFRFDLLVDGQFLLSGLLVFAFSRLSG